MSGGGFTLSKSRKILVSIVIIALALLSGASFIYAFPMDHVLTSILLLILGLVLTVIAIILFILILISK